MLDKKRVRFFLPFMVVGLLAALLLLLPLVPQPGLTDHLRGEFSKALQLPCQVRGVRFKVLPRPALEVDDLACSGPDFSLQVHSLNLDFSLLSLLSFSPQINGIHLRGVLAEIPFTSWSPDSGGQDKIHRLFAELLKSVNLGKERVSTLLSLDDAVCKMTGIPGCKSPLLFSNLEGVWQTQPQNQSENFALAGDLNGGRCKLQVTWYKVEVSSTPESGLLDKDAGDRLEITCRLQGVSMPESAALSLGSLENHWLADFEKADLELDINGNPYGGLRFAGKFAALDHHLSRSVANHESPQLWSQGALKANFSGFFQRRDGYLNIKNIFLEYPESATLFSRGLIRFREPLFVNLVNHFKVEDLGRTIHNCPPLRLSEYQCEGRLEGDLKLVGNPFSVPVLKLNLNSEKIVLRTVDPAAESLGTVVTADPERGKLFPENPVEPILEGQSDEASVGADWRDAAENLLRRLAKWEWIVKSDCRIDSLELPGMQLGELSFVAAKNLLQFEVERLAARFGPRGQVRLSLILDDLLHEPRWQASLVAEKLDLKPFKHALELSGVLDASLVGGGRLGADHKRGKELVMKGKWQLRQGLFTGSPLFVAFNRFLERQGRQLRNAGFSSFSSGFALRDKILRFDDFKINLSDHHLQARGRFFADGEQLDFSGRLSDKGAFLLPFHLSGTLNTPKFTAD